ncbi:MAG: HD domain-containing protein [Bacillota bacterium]
MDRNQQLIEVKKHVKNKNLIKHMLAVEAVMRELARHFGEDEEMWAMAGLLHDIDYDLTKDDPQRHSQVGADLLADQGMPAAVVQAVRVHNEVHGLARTTLLDKTLYAVDPVTGLIVAAALIHPEKRLSAIDADFVLNRFGEKSFARGANREQIKSCEELGLDLSQFIELSLKAMQESAADLGL